MFVYPVSARPSRVYHANVLAAHLFGHFHTVTLLLRHINQWPHSIISQFTDYRQFQGYAQTLARHG